MALWSHWCYIYDVSAEAADVCQAQEGGNGFKKTQPVYTLMNGALSWSDANAACLAKGLQLASVLSAAENALLATAAAGNNVWIGGTDANSEGTWVWSPSGTPLSYTNWRSFGEPNNSLGNEDCLEAHFSINPPGWNDNRCTGKQKYVCESRA